MEIDITEIIEAGCFIDYSASVAEIGANAGAETWKASMEAFDEGGLNRPLTLEEQLREARDYFATFGAWDEDEIENWSSLEVNALFLQMVAGDVREASPNIFEDYDSYQKDAERGTVSGRIYKGDIEGDESFGRWFYYVGS